MFVLEKLMAMTHQKWSKDCLVYGNFSFKGFKLGIHNARIVNISQGSTVEFEPLFISVYYADGP